MITLEDIRNFERANLVQRDSSGKIVYNIDGYFAGVCWVCKKGIESNSCYQISGFNKCNMVSARISFHDKCFEEIAGHEYTMEPSSPNFK